MLDGFTVSDKSSKGTSNSGIYTDPAQSGYQIRNTIARDNVVELKLNGSGATQSVVDDRGDWETFVGGEGNRTTDSGTATPNRSQRVVRAWGTGRR